jgi:hypothetical protein
MLCVISVKNSELRLQEFLTVVISVTHICDFARRNQASIFVLLLEKSALLLQRTRDS